MPERPDHPVTRLRVVYLDHVARLSGGELDLLRTLPALLDEVEPLVVLAEDGPLRERLTEAGIEVAVLPLSASVRDTERSAAVGAAVSPHALLDLWRYIRRLRALLRGRGAQIVHTNSLKAALYGGVAGRLAGVPVPWHVRDRLSADYPTPRTARLVAVAARVLPTALVANSQATLATLPRSSSAGVLNNPVVMDAVVPMDKRPARHARAPMIVTMGRLSP